MYLWVLMSFLCACSNIQGLRINNPDLPKGKQIIDEGLYYNDKDIAGHSAEVKHHIADKNTAQISIPVRYSETQNTAIFIRKLPEVTRKVLSDWDLHGEFRCVPQGDCKLNSNELALQLRYYRVDEDYTQVPPFPREFSIKNDWQQFNARNIGIQVNYRAEPEHLQVDCSSKSCAVVNQAGIPINEIVITKRIYVDEKRLNELIEQEKQDEARYKAEEAKRKAEEARRKAEKGRKWRQMERLRKKECPNLYRTLYWAQQTGYIEPIIGMKTAQRFEELDCGFWLNQQMNQAMF